ncbi:MAG: hypothetical protein ORN54_00215, partial [Cyclobacteriaceae bacterium]|nr:hypothetical protein [Cyclobacteriaceae bacterium]
MKRVFFILLLMGGCAKESSVAPAKAPTFVRYFNGGNNDKAESLMEASDGGLIILANTSIQNPVTLAITTRIKLIKTDAYGNQLWQKFYPEFPEVKVSSE